MNDTFLLNHIDLTNLRPTASWQDIAALCEQAASLHTASVCISPAYVERVAKQYGDLVTVCTVIGFPLGYQTTAVKVFEAKAALEQGAKEIDMVINLGDVKNRDFQKITEEIAAVKKAAGENIVKVIIETCYLTEEEKIILCRAVTAAGADYIKTSTGFGDKGAFLPDIALFRQNIGSRVKIKAAGGIRSKEEIKQFLDAGCDRIGSSNAAVLFQQK